jgi:hypothetical protein
VNAALATPPATRVSFDEYRAIKAVNWSRLKKIATSPLHYLHGLTAPDEDTPSKILGRAVHAAVLEPERLDDDYAVFDGAVRRGKDWDTFKAANADRTILKADEFALARSCGEAVRNHPRARAYLELVGEAEKTITWTDEVTGLPCKARLDLFTPGVLGDLKTARTIAKLPFLKQAKWLGYDGQLAHYRMGCRANGLDVQKVVLIAVENSAPFDVGVFVWDEERLLVAEQEVRALLDRLAECIQTRTFPGQHPDEVLVEADNVVGEPEITFESEE